LTRRPFLLTFNILLIIAAAYFLIGYKMLTDEPPDLLSYSFTVFAGYLFFILMPVELIFLYFAHTQDHSYFLLVPLTLGLGMGAQTVDYLIGKLTKKELIKRLISPRRYKKAEAFLVRYGNRAIFIFSVFPLSSPVLFLAAGMFHHRFGMIFFYGLLGLFIKYTAIFLFIA
jgi:membrane protein DedA with SNARE-associated domain